jgi:Glycosyltransferase family 87
VLGLGLLLLCAGLLVNWRNSQLRGEDFGHLFVISKSILERFDIYTATAAELPAVYRDYINSDFVPWGIFNLPSSGVALLPLALLPYGIAKVLYFILSTVVLLGGTYRLMQLFTDGLHFSTRILILGAVLCSAGARWGLFYLQAAPLVFGLLGLFLWELDKRRSGRAFAIGTLVIFLKFTLFLPFAGLALIRSRLLLVTMVVTTWVLTNVVGFALVGGMEAVNGYRTNMTVFERIDQPNYPDFRVPTSMQRLDWPYLLNAVSPDLPRSQIIAMVLSVLFAAWLIWEFYRVRRFADEPDTTVAFLGPLVCFSLLSVYHHHYDAIALLGPVIVYLGRPAEPNDRLLILLFVIPVILFVGLWPVEKSQQLVDAFLGEGNAGWLKLIGTCCVNFAFGVSLVLLHRFVDRRTGKLAAHQFANE